MIKLVNLRKPNKEKDIIVLYNTISIHSEKGDFELLVSTQIDITRIDPENHSHILDIINKYYNKNITVNPSPPLPTKKSWWKSK